MADIRRIQKDLEALRDLTEPCGEGTTRLSYTPAFRKAADYLKREMEACGLTVREDGVGNLWGLCPGEDPDAPTSSAVLIWTPCGAPGILTARRGSSAPWRLPGC
ncbi:MAG: hypothetical protein MR014_08840 [Oscillospiraceae bacterium]|nr:hypothetical protein [Oscillospiraceae bacterium]